MNVVRSFDPRPSTPVTGPRGQRAHPRAFEQSDRLARRLYDVRPGVWCMVGAGLSNQTFIEGPEGIIAIDTGESNEEMSDAIAELRAHTNRDIVAVIYSHFHYVNGTAAIGSDVPVYGHPRIATNLARVGGEIAPTYSRGIVGQFATSLPDDGPDGVVGVGLGLYYRNPAHARTTNGHRPVTHPLSGGEQVRIAGLDVHVAFTPSDADDSLTLWFPSLGVAVHNNLWPVLFNVYAIRGEEYRDPRVLVRGLDHLLSLEAEHLVATHGPPLSGREEIRVRTTRARDAIQFLWDQTVRGMNLGWTDDEIAHRVRLPEAADDDFYTSELYGVAEHHVRQIATGLRGFFDGDPAKLFPLEPHDRARRLVDGFGGVEAVVAKIDAALAADDVRWALELASWLVSADVGDASANRVRLAEVLRRVGYGSTAANIRNWCLTAARDLDGSHDLARFRGHRLRADRVAKTPTEQTAQILRVLTVPERAEGLDEQVAFVVGDATPVGLHIRNGITFITDGSAASATVALTPQQWGALISGSTSWDDLGAGVPPSTTGDPDAVARVLRCFDLDGTER